MKYSLSLHANESRGSYHYFHHSLWEGALEETETALLAVLAVLAVLPLLLALAPLTALATLATLVYLATLPVDHLYT